jgi:hypothetical protein
MKKLILSFTYMLLGLGFCLAQDSIAFKEKSHNFGTISNTGGVVTHDFEFINNYSTPLIIQDVKTTCGCTSPAWTKEPVESGKTGKITVTFNPSSYSAGFSKGITVTTNHAPNIQLTISGIVRSEPVKIDPKVEYPIEFGSYRLKTKDITFGKLSPDETKTVRLEVFNNSKKPISQRAEKTPKYIVVDFGTEPLAADSVSTIDVTFHAAKAGYGFFNGVLDVIIDGQAYQLNYAATVLDRFLGFSTEQKKNSGKINFSSLALNFDNLKKESSKVLKISNSGNSVLHIHNIIASDLRIKVSKTALNLNPKEIVEIKISLDAKKINEAFSGTISLFTDDVNKPLAEIKILGNP